MRVLIWKEIGDFLSSISGLIVVVIFLSVTSIFLWLLPGQWNILNNGYANLDGLFELAPMLYLFLVPAITMRAFAEEKNSGTIELLLTRPIPIYKIVLAKYVGAVILILISLIPTLCFYITVYLLGNSVGNLDSGAIMGSYLGLLFLASIYASIGIFASSLTKNQVVAFLLAIVISFFSLSGFDLFSALFVGSWGESFISSLGIDFHYASISRGLIDMRDILYFLSISAFYIFITTVKLSRNR